MYWPIDRSSDSQTHTQNLRTIGYTICHSELLLQVCDEEIAFRVGRCRRRLLRTCRQTDHLWEAAKLFQITLRNDSGTRTKNWNPPVSWRLFNRVSIANLLSPRKFQYQQLTSAKWSCFWPILSILYNRRARPPIQWAIHTDYKSGS